jgi:cell division protein FtsB
VVAVELGAEVAVGCRGSSVAVGGRTAPFYDPSPNLCYAPTPMWQEAKGRAALLVWSVAALGLCTATALDQRGIRRFLKLRAEVVDLRSRNVQAHREHDRLVRQVHALRDNPEAIERAVRQELGFIRPGELVLEMRAAGEVAEGPETGP